MRVIETYVLQRLELQRFIELISKEKGYSYNDLFGNFELPNNANFYVGKDSLIKIETGFQMSGTFRYPSSRCSSALRTIDDIHLRIKIHNILKLGKYEKGYEVVDDI